jgi:hypothetical protein
LGAKKGLQKTPKAKKADEQGKNAFVKSEAGAF